MQFYYSQPKILKNLAFALFIFYLCYRHFNNQVGLYFIAPLLVLSLWGTISMFLKKEPVLVIDEHGVLDNSKSGYGLIPWADIISLEAGKGKTGSMLCINVIDKDEYFNKVPVFRRFFINLINAPVAVYFMSISPELKDACEYLKTNYPDKIVESSLQNPRKLNSNTWKFWVFFLVIFAVVLFMVIYFHWQ